MGTFIIRPTALASGGSPIIDGLGAIPPNYSGWLVDNYPVNTILSSVRDTTNAQELQFDVFADTGANSGNDTVRFDFTGACIYLDGSLIPVTFASLPAGFTPDTASVKIVVESVQQPTNPPGSTVYRLQQSSIDDGPDNTDTFPYVFTPTPPTMLDLVSNGCGIKCIISVPNNPDAGAVAIIYNLRVEGTYHVVTYTFSLDTPSPIQPGDNITITTDPQDPNHLPIENVDNVKFTLGTTNVLVTPIVKEPGTLVAVTPYGFGGDTGTVTISVIIDGDPVVIGTLEILNTNGSGVYVLTRGKTNDTVYEHDGSGGTNEIAIPQPFFKTGFIGG